MQDLLVAALAVTMGLSSVLCLVRATRPTPALDPFERVKAWFAHEAGPSGERHRFRLVSVLTPKHLQRKVLRLLQSAGVPLEVEEALLLWSILTLACALSGFILAGLPGLSTGLAVSGILPVLVLRSRSLKRRRRMEGQIPDLLDLLASGLRAGFSFFQSLQHASGQMEAPIGPTLQHVITEMTVGFDVETALRRWVERTGSLDLELAVSAILIQREVGGNLAEVLDNISSIMRDRREAQMEMRSLTAQGRMEGWIISLLPVALGTFFTLTRPDYMAVLFNTPQGIRMLGISAVCGVIGIFLVNRIVRPRY
ncbi:MAG: type II secretion system F family protein [Synergistales bacterium]|jgi:tight adherence protein B